MLDLNFWKSSFLTQFRLYLTFQHSSPFRHIPSFYVGPIYYFLIFPVSRFSNPPKTFLLLCSPTVLTFQFFWLCNFPINSSSCSNLFLTNFFCLFLLLVAGYYIFIHQQGNNAIGKMRQLKTFTSLEYPFMVSKPMPKKSKQTFENCFYNQTESGF